MKNNIELAEDYYHGFVQMDLAKVSSHLHQEVRFIAPMGELIGKDAVLEAAKRLVNIMKGLTIRARFSRGD
jgi:SnoaL-like domain